MPGRALDAAVFDFDGTLVHPTIDFGRMRAAVAAILDSHGVGEPSVRSLRIWEMVGAAARVLEGRGEEPSRMREEAFAAIGDIECEAARRAKPIEGVPRMLGRLRGLGVEVAVITRNSGKAARIAWAGLEDACDVFLPRESVPHVKPHPAHLERCFELLKSPPSRALMVGDHPIDLESGKRHRMAAAGVLTGSGTEAELRAAGADWIFNDATGVLGLFETAPAARGRREP